MIRCPMCDRKFALRYEFLNHVHDLHGIWSCKKCKTTFARENNFNYHTRICEFKATGVKRSSSEQVGEGKRIMLNAPQEDPLEISVELFDSDVVAGMTEMERILSTRSPIAQFYL